MNPRHIIQPHERGHRPPLYTAPQRKYSIRIRAATHERLKAIGADVVRSALDRLAGTPNTFEECVVECLPRVMLVVLKNTGEINKETRQKIAYSAIKIVYDYLKERGRK